MSLENDLADLGLPGKQAPRAEPTPPKPEPVQDGAEHPMAAQWRRWKPEFAKAMDGAFHTPESLETLIFQNRAQFFPGRNCAIVTEVVNYPGERVMQATWAAGDVDEIISMIPGIESVGRLMGCKSVLVEGRGAWTRVLKGSGFKPWSTTLRKEL